ncbi:MAG: prephenate dehydrogenase [Nitrospiraceae bacterium]|nr:prephenate dehydrogenase [Nitrospiraceae bacterium]
MSKLYFKKITILGTGLIGASLALAIKKNKLSKHITGYGRSETNLKKALDKKIIDSYELDINKACAESDLIVFAMPVGCFLDTIKKIAGSLKNGAIVTDVGSVKGNLVAESEKFMFEDAAFVGGHPIAGSEKTGIDTAKAELFSGAKCILTPTARTDKTALSEISELWKALGSDVILMSPDEHDRIFAAVSHLPHVAAYALINTIGEKNKSYLDFAGAGFKDTTRIAASSPELWRDICIMNKDNILELLELLKKNLDDLSRHIKAKDSGSLEQEFKKAKTLRDNVR